jgi:hypothetical protein
MLTFFEDLFGDYAIDKAKEIAWTVLVAVVTYALFEAQDFAEGDFVDPVGFLKAVGAGAARVLIVTLVAALGLSRTT